MRKTQTIGAYSFEVNHPKKLFFPKTKLSKVDVMNYYDRIAEYILPHLKDRPLTVIRFPNGIEGKKFFQKNAPDYFPDWIERKTIEKQGGDDTHYVICNNKATLVYLASQACINLHIWLSTKSALNKPDRLIFDLDPSEDDFVEVKFAARKIRKLLNEKLNLPTFIMTTGSRGLHVVVPLKPEKEYDQVRKFARNIADYLVHQYPDRLTTEVRKEYRKNKLFLDVVRNAFAQTSVVPYGLRSYEKAPVATPMDWDELSSLQSAQDYAIKNIFRRLGSKKDPWGSFQKQAVSLNSAIKNFNEIK